MQTTEQPSREATVDQDIHVTITITQSLTGPTTSVGRFRLMGGATDEGETTEELTFGGPLTEPTVPVSFRRTLKGDHGSLTLLGSAVLTWSSRTTATISGTWEVEHDGGGGTLSGSADFGTTPPSGVLEYVGTFGRWHR